MKYGFIGSHGSGKSAAAHFLAAKLKKEDPSSTIKVLEEAVRENSKLTGINNTQFQKLSILDSLYNQVLYSSTYNVLICDRIAFDYIVYAQYYGVHLPTEYIDIAIQNAKEFDTLYFVRPDNTPIIHDGFRFTDVEERNEIDKLFKSMLLFYEIPFQELSSAEIFQGGLDVS